MRWKKMCSLLIVLSLLLVVGCSKTTTTSAPETPELPKASKTSDTISIAYIAAGTTSPQPLINQKVSIFGDELNKLGKKVKFETTRSLDKVWPLMDQENGAPDFVYIPAANFGTYVTKNLEKFGGSDKYTIIAGSFNNNGTVIIVNPKIKSLKDLAGKKIAIANTRYVDEFQLTKVLATAGLKTSTDGGNVEVVWEDIVPKMIDNWAKGQYDAMVLYAAENYSDALAKVKGSQILTTLNPNNLFGAQAPRYWLIVKKDLLKDNPELVKAVLKAHIASTEKAIAEKDMLPGINRDIYLQYFKNLQVKDLDKLIQKNSLEAFQKRWKQVEITYDPNSSYVNQVFDFMIARGYLKDKTTADFFNPEPLNQVLKDMGKPEIK